MHLIIGRLCLVFCIITTVFAKGNPITVLDYEDPSENELIEEDEERFIIIPALTVNITSLSTFIPLALIGISSLVSLLGTIALGIILLSLLAKLKYEDGYGSYSSGYHGGGHGGSHGHSSYRSIFDDYILDWENFSILDWIKVGQEVWDKYEPMNPECQKRLICEIHENVGTLGYAAEIFVEIFEYLNFAKILRLPKEIQTEIDGYLDAAETPYDSGHTCADGYSDCKFSVIRVVDEYKLNHDQ